jgi:hypothetical protein
MYDARVRTPALPSAKRITAAKLAGAISRLGTSATPLEERLAEVLAVTQDPEILGHELGCRLGQQYPSTADARAVEVLRAAGADEDYAARVAEWLRWKWARRAEGGFTL